MRRFGLVSLLFLAFGSVSIPAWGAAGPNLTVDVTGPSHPISPYIYGMNFADPELAAEIELPLNRFGGNDTSRYDYSIDTSSKGRDWYFSNIPYRIESGEPTRPLPEESNVFRYIRQNQSWGGETIITVPMIGWMPKAEAYDCSFHVDIYGPQEDVEPYRHDCGNGVLPDETVITWNDPTEASRVIDETFVTQYIADLVAEFGPAAAGGIKLYNLDNEPMLWFDTHRDVFQGLLGYDGLRDRTILYARAVKDVDPTAMTLGPVGYGWEEYFYSDIDRASGWGVLSDYHAHGEIPLVEWYLQQMAAYEASPGGIRILDYLDEHFYPFFVALNNETDSGMAEQRLRATRFLWDPTFNQQPDNWYVGEPFRMIPRMKEWVANNYPGTKTAITEYNFGALNKLNGALAQADVLGIFGREGLDLAALWAPPSASQPGAYAFRMYLNYDGSGSKFGDVSVSAASANHEQVSVFAATRTTDGALTIMVINKSGVERTSNLSVIGFDSSPAVEVWQYSGADLSAIEHKPDALIVGGALTHTFPAESITLLVLSPPAGVSTELLQNTSFENGATAWTAANPTKDKVKCNPEQPAKVAATGECGLQLTGTDGVTTKFTQNLAAAAGATNDLVVLAYMGKGRNLTASAQVNVALDTTGGTLKFKKKLPKGGFAWQAFGSTRNLPGDMTGGKVQIIINSGGGKLNIDDVSLSVQAPRRNVLPPPVAPAGFRH